jgi:hypothetical protein
MKDAQIYNRAVSINISNLFFKTALFALFTSIHFINLFTYSFNNIITHILVSNAYEVKGTQIIRYLIRSLSTIKENINLQNEKHQLRLLQAMKTTIAWTVFYIFTYCLL